MQNARIKNLHDLKDKNQDNLRKTEYTNFEGNLPENNIFVNVKYAKHRLK